MQCYFCHKELEIGERVGRQDTCPHCSRDLHICKNCQFYDENAYNECHEPQADRVVEKERSNFCDYFVFITGGGDSRTAQKENSADETKRKLEALFKK